MDIRFGLERKLSAEELMLLTCGVGEDSWESLGQQGNQSVHPKGNQSWIFIGRTDVEAETPDVKNWLIGKDPNAGKDWRQEEKGTTEEILYHMQKTEKENKQMEINISKQIKYLPLWSFSGWSDLLSRAWLELVGQSHIELFLRLRQPKALSVRITLG